MDRHHPYFAPDTDGVHFQVRVDGRLAQGYVARAVLDREPAVSHAAGDECVEAYLSLRDRVDAAVACRVRAEGYETVLVRSEEVLDRSGATQSDPG